MSTCARPSRCACTAAVGAPCTHVTRCAPAAAGGQFALYQSATCRYHQQHGQQLGNGSEEDTNELGLVLHISAVQQELAAKLAAWLPALAPAAEPGPSSQGDGGREPRGRQASSAPGPRQGPPSQSDAEAANGRCAIVPLIWHLASGLGYMSSQAMRLWQLTGQQ